MEQQILKKVQRTILLNPGPATATESVKASLVQADICPREEEFGDLLKSVKSKLLDLLITNDYELVLLGGSGTAAIESCLSSATSRGGKLLILENGAYGKRMNLICERLGINVEVLSSTPREAINSKVVRDFLNDRKGEFETLCFIHHETTTGVLNSIDELTAIGKEFGLSVMVDAMSSFAGIPIDLKKAPVDYLISSSNKCIQAMAGLGIIYVSHQERRRIRNNPKRSYYLDLESNLDSQEQKGQFLFTPPVQILYSLNAAIDELIEEGGIEARVNRYQRLYKLMLTGMKELGFELFTKEEDNSGILTTFFEPKREGFSFEGMHSFFFQRGITIYPGKVSSENTFRISNIGDLEEEDIQLFLESMNEYLKGLKG